MSDPVLADAARALREAHDGSSPNATRTRTRILAAALARRKRRPLFVVGLVPLAATLVLSLAWAAATGRLTRWVESLRGTSPTVQTASAPAPPPTLAHAPAPAPAPSLPLAPSADDDGDATAIDVESLPVASSAPSSTAPPSRAGTPDASAGAEEALYAVAHQAHFVAHDPAAALRAWDAYLAAYPKGRFALEARYNRALTLVRLGRTDEARAALAPFADGRFGGYRQREAKELLDALDGGT